MMNGKKIIVILPAYNEQGKISNVVRKVKTQIAAGIVDECLVVNDGSTDATAAEAEKEGATLISKENAGVGSAIRSGLGYASDKNYDIAVIMAGDDQDDPSEIRGVVSPIAEGNRDFVQGSRRIDGGRVVNMPLFRSVTTKIYSYIFKFTTGFPCTDGTNGFRAIKLSVLKNKKINLAQKWLDTYELEPYLFYKVVALGYNVSEAPVTKRYHKGIVGYTKMVPVKDWWNILKPLVYLKIGLKK
ncbi:glycosyltransferase family 2 protein [bacterium]|nr:glycosyltransferase family 2 protein [Candidatus Omnitrophota bacterium]MBU3930697.1 glycosyltransferase family 2 protein [bacterium]MBU4122770.1 glycosyltransferase family 2 protein [bacterium]